MTTGMKTEPTVERRPGRKWNWLWFVLALVVASALVGLFTTPKPPKTDNNATSGSVQNSATGQQGSTGMFREEVVPNEHTGTITGSPMNTPPSSVSRGQGKGLPASESTGGSDAGAGNSGITSTQEGLGGATPRGNKSGAEQTTPSR